jgi:hypothetical protein
MKSKVKRQVTDLCGAGGTLRNLVISSIPCACEYTADYEEYLRLIATLTSTVTTAEERLMMFVKYQFDGKQVDRVCDACRAVNEWDDLLETV